MRVPLFALAIFGATVCGLSTQAAPTPRYTITDLGTVPGSYGSSFPLSMNNLGEVVGLYTTAGGGQRPFAFQNGAMFELPIKDATCYAEHNNDLSQVIGHFAVPEDPIGGLYDHAYLYSNGTVIDLSATFRKPLLVRGINSLGHCVGIDRTIENSSSGFIYSNGVFQAINLDLPTEFWSINDRGQIMGQVYPIVNGLRVPRTFILHKGEIQHLGLLPGTDTTQGIALNNEGCVVGSSHRVAANGAIVGFVYLHKRLLGVPPLPGHVSSHLNSINDDLVAVGFSSDQNATPRAIVWEHGKRTDLNTLVPPNSGWEIVSAAAINNSGQIAATGYRNGKLQALLLNPTRPGKNK